MFRLLLLFVIWFQACSAGAGIATTEKRVALVIGNGSYQIGALPNAINDSILINQALKDVGFETILLQDASQREMVTAIRGFSEMLKNADAGFFYYAGHAIEIYGENYLIPVDVKDLKAELIKYDAVNVEQIMDTMEVLKSPINIMVLDACRDNPFRSFSRSASRGLAPMMSSVQGLFVAFSAAPGKTATDGVGQNSPYTKALAKYIREPGMSIHEVFSSVRAQVIDETGSKQVPWESHSLIGNFYFSEENG